MTPWDSLCQATSDAPRPFWVPSLAPRPPPDPSSPPVETPWAFRSFVPAGGPPVPDSDPTGFPERNP
jgi:hypothetical protein